ncbi:transporter substrate-binding domain-containing protein [Granulicoccus phenolivorans]|uniref:transporter substrate-binding domain-containing protein n=1 Tax=Granulicoccus phenolivorans TaxID=266854 RepID=UPI000413174D|nr:transporter substrate-binding domain-containing protein [Granulicoccus phenolivorans]
MSCATATGAGTATVLAVAALLALNGCARPQSPGEPGTATPAVTEPAAVGAPDRACPDQLATYPPAPADQRIGLRPFRAPLRVAVSDDAPGLASADLKSGRLEGLEIDLARALAEEFTPGTAPDLRVRDEQTAIAELTDGKVDLVIRQLAITCRPDRGAPEFSAPYLQTPITILSRDAQLGTAADLSGRRVCAVNHSTAMTQVLRAGARAVPAESLSACLLRQQQGTVDAVVGEHAVLAAFAALDHRSRLGSEKLGTTYFGVAAASGGVNQIRLTNLVLQERSNSGTWADSYNRWVRPYAGSGSAPQPNYGRKP